MSGKQRVKRIQVYLPPEIVAHFEAKSQETLAPVSALVRQFIIKHFNQEAERDARTED